MVNMTCPRCGKRMLLNFSTNVVSCPHCGFIRPDEITRISEHAEALRAKGQRKSVTLTFRGDLIPAARAAFETGQDHLFNGDSTGAIGHFKRAISFQPEFIDAHLWIAKTTDDAKIKHEFLSNVLAQTPNHLEATRLMMVLNGRLTPEQVARTYNDNASNSTQTLSTASAKIQALLCPQCGGHLTINEARECVECASCGFVGAIPRRTVGDDSLMMALIERRANPVKWNIGKRTFQCQQCGTQHTVTAEKMTARCRFCGSTQVILSDAVGAFEQPDGLVPFKLTGDQARILIDKRLRSPQERASQFLFNGSKIIETGPVEGAYLPFWAFDADIEVTQYRTNHANVFQESRPDKWLDMMNDIAVCAVSTISESITSHLDDYQLGDTIGYEPKWLAKVPAQVYSVDFDAASLTARERIADRMRLKYRAQVERNHTDETGETRKEIIRTSTVVRHMSFQLLLCPIWMMTLAERDGDVRLAVVNGQTGKTAIGMYQKKESKDTSA